VKKNMTENTPEEIQKIAESRMQELLCCALMCEAREIRILPASIEITVAGMVTTPLMRAAVSLQDCYPDGGVYVAARLGMLVLCVYYEKEA
jgi:hypothetical protein